MFHHWVWARGHRFFLHDRRPRRPATILRLDEHYPGHSSRSSRRLRGPLFSCLFEWVYSHSLRGDCPKKTLVGNSPFHQKTLEEYSSRTLPRSCPGVRAIGDCAEGEVRAMRKLDIARRVHQEAGISEEEAATLLEWILELFKTTLQKGEPITIPGFGKLTVR